MASLYIGCTEGGRPAWKSRHKYENEMLHDWRWPCRRGGSVSVRAPLLLGGIRREQARDLEGHRHEARVDESAHLGVPGCEGRSGQPAALAVRRWSAQY